MGFALVLQRGVHLFCFNDVGLFGLFVENGVRQRFILVKQGDVARCIFADSHLGIAHGIGWAFGLDLVDDLLELHSQIFRECARFLPGQDARKIILGSEWAVGVVLADGFDAKAAVEVVDEFRQVGIARFQAGDAAQAHLLDQPVLQGLVGALDASFRLRGIGADDLDLEFPHGAPELGQVVSITAVGYIDPKDAVFIAVEGYRLAIALKISLRRCAVAEKALASHEQQLQQFASSIVDKHQQHTARSASFEPVVR